MYTRGLLIAILLVLSGTLICCRANPGDHLTTQGRDEVPLPAGSDHRAANPAARPAVFERRPESPVAIAPVWGGLPGTTPTRRLLANHLTQRDFSAPDARVLVASLTDDDVRVLAQNPQMLCLAGDKGEADLALAALIGVGIGIGAVVLLASALAMG